MAVSYEWVIEQLAGPDVGDDVEILDVDHADTYGEARARAAQHPHARIGLVRDVYAFGSLDRSWAYVRDGVLAEAMTDAYGHTVAPVPSIYRRQFEAAALSPSDKHLKRLASLRNHQIRGKGTIGMGLIGVLDQSDNPHIPRQTRGVLVIIEQGTDLSIIVAVFHIENPDGSFGPPSPVRNVRFTIGGDA